MEELEQAVPRQKQDPETFALRARPRPAIRFRKGLIVVGSALGLTGVVGASWIALRPSNLGLAASDDPRPGLPPRPEELGGAFAYSDVPRLGPPLPGDLGRAIVARQRAEQPAMVAADDAVRTERSRLLTEAALRRAAEAHGALTSPLLVRSSERSGGAARSGPRDVAAEGAAADSTATPAPVARASLPGWSLAAGTIISASLVTGLNSDLPGVVIAQVTENVRDSRTGQVVLVPQGARLIGRYDSKVGFGQQRAFLVWEQLVYPDGSSVELGKMPATDAAGFAGLRDSVNFHEGRLLQGIALATLLGIGGELALGAGGDRGIARAIRESAGQEGTRAGETIVSRNLDVQPTLVVRPGWPVRALVERELSLKPWSG